MTDSVEGGQAAVFEVQNGAEGGLTDRDFYRKTFSLRAVRGLAISQIVLAVLAMICQVYKS